MNKEFMELAIKKAKESEIDIPIGCVIEKNGEILSCTHNLKEKTNLVINHAEILALVEAQKKLDNWRLVGCNLYVTLEPCPMCAWAILNSGIEKVYFGAYDSSYGAFGSKINLLNLSSRKLKIYGGIMEDECGRLIYDYFENIRKNKAKL